MASSREAGEAEPVVAFQLSHFSIANDFFGSIELAIDGLEPGETVLVEKYQVQNTVGLIDEHSLLQQSIELTDGRAEVVAGTPNLNVPFDLTGKDCSIRARVSFQDGYVPNIIGNYAFKLSSPTGRFEPLVQPFRVEATAHEQAFIGTVTSNGEPVPYCYVVALRRGGLDRFTLEAGVVADEQGHYILSVEPGWYDLVAIKPGFVSPHDDGNRCLLEAGVNCEVDRELEKGTTVISGKVTEFLNPARMLAGVQIILQSEGRITVSYTDAKGEFRVTVSPGKWEVVIPPNALHDLGYVARVEPLIVDTTEADPAPLSIQLPKAAALVRGVIENWIEEKPVAGIQVQAHNEDYRYMAYGVTDEEGRYVIAVAPGYWYAQPLDTSLTAKGHVATYEQLAYAEAGWAVEADFFVEPIDTRASGSVKSDSGEAIGNITLIGEHHFYDDLFEELVGTGSFVVAEVNPDGRFDVGIIGGAWIFRTASDELNAKGLVPGDAFFFTDTGLDVDNVVVPARTASGSLRVHLADESSKPVGDYPVYGTLYDEENDSNYEIFGQTDANGFLALPVFKGKWILDFDLAEESLFRSFETPEPAVVTVESDDPLDFPFTLTNAIKPPISMGETRIADGVFKAKATASPGYWYILEASTDLIHWEILTAYQPEDGVIGVAEAIPPGSSRYFRFR